MIELLQADAGPARVVSAALVLASYAVFTLLTVRSHRARSSEGRQGADALDTAAGGTAVLIVFASQTGFAEELATRTTAALKLAGVAAAALDIRHLDLARLERTRRALFIVSTTGEGDAPDAAAHFRSCMNDSARLGGLTFAVLALGDRAYAQYCAFGRAIEAWLRASGASPLFDMVEVDDGDDGALRHWQGQLRELAGGADIADWNEPAYGRWQLSDRRLLNAGSPGGPAFHVTLKSLDAAVEWRAGDVLEVGPRNSKSNIETFLESLGLSGEARVLAEGETVPFAVAVASRTLPLDPLTRARLSGLCEQETLDALASIGHREYSIASPGSSPAIELLIRQVRGADGRLGVGSGWLTAHAEPGCEIAARVRRNRAFHGPDDDRPMILIGNGTGLAGLRAHIAERAARGRRRNWLLFGERTSRYDFFFRDEIERWRDQRDLTRVDLAFSRDQAERRYVQHAVSDAGDELTRWVADGAAIYVCGSLHGMSTAVHATLEGILGGTSMSKLMSEGRYRRDVY